MTTPSEQDRRPIRAVIPGRLAASVPGQDVQALAEQEWWKTAEQVASDWQFWGDWAEWWEMTTAPRFGRANELVGLIASAGEQLALGMAALVETELWRAYRDANPVDDTEPGRGLGAAEEMGHRAMAELAGYYLLGTGHGLALVAACQGGELGGAQVLRNAASAAAQGVTSPAIHGGSVGPSGTDCQ